MRSTASRRRATAASRFSLESDHFLAYRRDPVNDTLTMLRTRRGALLAELHAHTTWSDGSLALPGLVDLYGSRGFDVLCITDHVCRTDLADAPEGITAANYGPISPRSTTRRAGRASVTTCSWFLGWC
jgi:hypothetical protein